MGIKPAVPASTLRARRIQADRLGGFLLVLLYFFCATFALILLTLIRPHTDDGLLHQVGKNCALVAFILLVMQAVLASRLHWVERHFGMDMLFRYHKAVAVLALGLLVLHLTLIAWGSRHWELVGGVSVPVRVWLGRVTLLLLLANVVISLWRRKLKIEFQRWRLLHNALGVALLSLGLLHGRLMGGDLSNPPLWGFWLIAFTLSAGTYLFHKTVRPALLGRNRYTVIEVRQEAPKVWTIRMKPPAGSEVFPHAPGQFQYITFYRGRGLPVEEHHWTISSTPTRPGVASTIKESGDFTSTIGRTQPGDQADVHGAYGRFSYLFYPGASDLLFVCAGIGITPFLSMLRHMHDTGARKNVLLLWGNRTEQDIVAREELEQIEASGLPQLKTVHFLTNPGEGWQGECGRIDRESIARYLSPEEAAEREVYVCCPPPMFKDLAGVFRDMRIPARRIHYEGFAL